MSRRELIEKVIYGTDGARRYTQDTPILPDVWLEYVEHPTEPTDLLLTPYQGMRAADNTPGMLCKILRDRLRAEIRAREKRGIVRTGEPPEVAYNQTTVAARLRFHELVRLVLPMSAWWNEQVFKVPPEQEGRKPSPSGRRGHDILLDTLKKAEGRQRLARALARPYLTEVSSEALESDSSGVLRAVLKPEILWMVRVIGTIALIRDTASADRAAWPWFLSGEAKPENGEAPFDYYLRLVEKVADLLAHLRPPDDSRARVHTVSRNRKVRTAVCRSRMAVKADAATRVFEVSCKEVAWAIVDSGIDAEHYAFRKRGADTATAPNAASSVCEEPFATETATGRLRNNTRIVATYDFTKIRDLLNPETPNTPMPGGKLPPDLEARQLRTSLLSGREIDWNLLLPYIQIQHETERYQRPIHEHGTHVAGILGGDWRATDPKTVLEEDLRGICPDINLYDLRVLDDRGEGDEFNVMAALQFVRSLNAHKDYMVVHGVNLSLSTPHDVANYACGRTPICEECERLVNSGIVVVAAAGNEGYLQYMTAKGALDGYRNISITDPGNAESVITVGATHRDKPHAYGVSYFSSRGPTGDGRLKPDLVAPGEKIEAPVPNNEFRRKDGTSMAAPHVSGAAALLIARHRELMGQPLAIKTILCNAATDLNRERYFQGAGMLDILRALQSV